LRAKKVLEDLKTSDSASAPNFPRREVSENAFSLRRRLQHYLLKGEVTSSTIFLKGEVTSSIAVTQKCFGGLTDVQHILRWADAGHCGEEWWDESPDVPQSVFLEMFHCSSETKPLNE
jgi:hypothetical protein